MEIKVYKNDEHIYIIEPLSGLDLYNAEKIKELIMKLVEKSMKGVILDLKKVGSIGSAGIGALISISSTMQKINCDLAIINYNNNVKKAIEMTKLTNYLPSTPTLKQAVEQIRT